MSTWNMPPGVTTNDIPGNEPETRPMSKHLSQVREELESILRTADTLFYADAADTALTALSAHEEEVRELVAAAGRASPALWDAISKLESQIIRNQDLPRAYNEIFTRAATLLRTVDNVLAKFQGEKE